MSRRVLLVEDSPTQAVGMVAMLHSIGYEVEHVTSAEDAWDLAQTGRFDVVLTDLHLPKESGFDLCRRVKQSFELKDLPVVVLTAQADPTNVLQGLEAGADGFTTKGARADALLVDLDTIIANASADDPISRGGVAPIVFKDRTYEIRSGRREILNVLVASFEDVVKLSEDLEESRRSISATLSSVLDTVPIGIVTVDAHGTVRMANRALVGLLGTSQLGPASSWVTRFSITDSEGRPLPDDGHPIVQTLRDHKARTNVGLQVATSNNTREDVLVSTQAVLEEDDDTLAEVIATWTPITEQKRMERVLREREEQYLLAAAGARDGLWDWDLVRNTIYLSPRWKEMLGYEEADIGDSPQEWFDRVHQDDIDGLWEALDGHLQQERERHEHEHRMRHRDGTYRWMLSRGQAVFDELGAAQRLAGWMTDISERRKTAAVREKAVLLEQATRAVGIGIAIVTAPSSGAPRLRHPSDTLREMTASWGSDGTAWIGDVWANAQLPEPQKCAICNDLERVGTCIVDLTSPAAARRVFSIVFAGHSHEVAVEIVGDVMLVSDITERARAEESLRTLNEELTVARDQAIAASKAKSIFLANVSHELQTPLHAIIGYSELISEYLEEDEVTSDAVSGDGDSIVRDLSIIRDSAQHLKRLINDVLDLSRFEASEVKLNTERFAIRDTVDTAINTVRQLATTGGNMLFVEVEDDQLEVEADRTKVEQILLNLLTNACKFTEEGSITLRVRRDPSSTRWLVLTVEDSGIGIPDSEKEAIFEPFSQVDSSATDRSYQGTGLGLSICRHIARAMGGDIAVESELGQGTTFTVRLPVAIPVRPGT